MKEGDASRHARLTRARCAWAFLVILMGAGAYVFWDVGRPFNQTDEFLYAGVTLQMLESGDYVTPRFGPVQLLTKPPLFYWLSAPIVASIGHPEVAMRLLPGISFLLTMSLIFRLVQRHWSPPVGLTAALIFLLCYDHLFNHAYRSGVMEGVLNLLMAVVLWLNMQLRESPTRIRWIAVVLALALLTKSAFAIIPAALTAANMWLNRRDYRITRRLLLQSLALFSAIILPWFLLVIRAHGNAVLDYMIIDQIWKRAINDSAAAAQTGRTFGRKESFYVLRHFLEYGQPWSLLVWPALWSATRRRLGDTWETSALLRLCCVWFIGVLLLFLAARGRWSWYISSAYIPASILIAAMFREFWRNAGDQAAPWVWAGAGAIFFASHSPFLFNPYAVSSGRFPLYWDARPQMFAFLMMVVVVLAIYRRGNEVVSENVVKLRAACVLILATGATSLLVVVAHREFAPYLVSAVAGPAAAAVCLSMLALVPMRNSLFARAACLVCPFLLAVGYLTAPLHWSNEDNRRREIKRVERKIAAGYFRQEQTLELAHFSLFSFVPIYATFSHDFQVTYDAEKRIVTLAPLANARGEPGGPVE